MAGQGLIVKHQGATSELGIPPISSRIGPLDIGMCKSLGTATLLPDTSNSRSETASCGPEILDLSATDISDLGNTLGLISASSLSYALYHHPH